MVIKGARVWDHQAGEFVKKEVYFQDGVFCEHSGEGIVNASGLYMLPGLIDAHSHIGMWEEAVGTEGADGNESSDPWTPHLRAIDAINPMDKAFEKARQGGVTTVATGPGSTNVLGGQVAIIKTWGLTLDEMVVNPYCAMKVALGENPKRYFGANGKPPITRMAIAAILRTALMKARDYYKRKTHAENPTQLPPFDEKLESLIPVLEKKVPMKFHVHRADDIATAIRIAREFDLRITLDHCTEGHLIPEAIMNSGFPAIVGPSFGVQSKVELKNMTFDTPGSLHRNGVKVAIMTDHPVHPQSSLILWAIMAHKSGVEEKDALQMVTRNPAQILGIDKNLGSIEVGKEADFALWDKHPLDIYSSVRHLFIRGKQVI